METSTRSSAPPSTSALKGQQRSNVVELARANIEEHLGLNEAIESERVVEWLQNIMPLPQEVVPGFSTSSDHAQYLVNSTCGEWPRVLTRRLSLGLLTHPCMTSGSSRQLGHGTRRLKYAKSQLNMSPRAAPQDSMSPDAPESLS